MLVVVWRALFVARIVLSDVVACFALFAICCLLMFIDLLVVVCWLCLECCFMLCVERGLLLVACCMNGLFGVACLLFG